MKVIARKEYYTEDLYSALGQGGGFTKEKLENFADHIRKLSKIEHRKGDFKDYEVKAEKFCCIDLEECGEARAESLFGVPRIKADTGIFLPFQGYGEADYVHIEYCPFCGEKIEIVEKE